MSRVPREPADDLLRDPWFPLLKEYLIKSTGLAYYATKEADLARRLGRRLSGFGFRDCASYLERLRDPGLGPAEMDALIAEITIGESYFFRHREHFEALRDVILPDLIARNAGGRRLRIWCAGCADGAEPYSLSILLRRELGHLLLGWDVSILGTDINRRYLASACAGRFEEWSLRATPPDIRHACFEGKGKQWIIAPEYRAGVSFQFHNLVENSFPPLSDIQAFDLIICRNVMIYFDPERMRTIVSRFHACLEPGAWLLVGPAEPNMSHFTSFQAVNAPGVTLYQRPVSSPGPQNGKQRWEIGQRFPEATPEAIAEPVTGSLGGPATPRRARTGEGVGSPPLTLADLLRYADRGEWENAARCGKELLESDKLNALVHFHYALVLEQTGDSAGAERSLRRAIYLNRQAALAHYHLGLLLQSRGEQRQAFRCFDNVLNVLASQADEVLLSGVDGISVAELRKLARMQLAAPGMEASKEEV